MFSPHKKRLIFFKQYGISEDFQNYFTSCEIIFFVHNIFCSVTSLAMSLKLRIHVRKCSTRVQSTVMELKVVTNSSSMASIGLGSSTDVLLVAVSRLHEVRSNVKIHNIGFESSPLCCCYRKELHTTRSLVEGLLWSHLGVSHVCWS